jgi:hypothetical protein
MMEVALMAGLPAKRNMDVNTWQRFLFLVPISIGIIF